MCAMVACMRLITLDTSILQADRRKRNGHWAIHRYLLDFHPEISAQDRLVAHKVRQSERVFRDCRLHMNSRRSDKR